MLVCDWKGLTTVSVGSGIVLVVICDIAGLYNFGHLDNLTWHKWPISRLVLFLVKHLLVERFFLTVASHLS